MRILLTHRRPSPLVCPDTDVLIWEGDASDPTLKPPEMYTLLENFCLGLRRLEIFGRARTVRVELAVDGGGRVLRVRDDGTGFDPASARREGPGYGLVSMGERARALPGTLEVDSRVGGGSEVRVRW